MVTARSDIVKLSPGIYQLSTVLKAINSRLMNPHYTGERVTGERGTGKRGRKPYPLEKIRERKARYHRIYYHRKRGECERIYREIYALPDGDTELWNR